MISINFDTATGIAKLAQPAIIKETGDVRVKVIFTTAPGAGTEIEFTLLADAADPATLAFTDVFESENATTWTALLDANDTRLVAHLNGKNGVTVNGELRCFIDGEWQIAPNVSVSVQPARAPGPATSEGGPTYYTQAQVDAAIAAAVPRYFSAALSDGMTGITIYFTPAFASVPKLGGFVIERPLEASPHIAVASVRELSTGSVVVEFDAPVPGEGYLLHGSAKV